MKKKTGAKRADERPLEVRYREAEARIIVPDGCGGTTFRTDFTQEEWDAFCAVAKEWQSPAEREKRDELAYNKVDADYIRAAFEDTLAGPCLWHYMTLTEREKRRAVGLYDGSKYKGGPELMGFHAALAAERWLLSLPRGAQEAASRREFERRITEGDGGGVPGVAAADVERYGWSGLVKEAGLVLDAVTERYYPRAVYDGIEAKRKAEAQARETAKREAELGRSMFAALANVGMEAVNKSIAAAARAANVPATPAAPVETPQPEKKRGYMPTAARKAAAVAIVEHLRRAGGSVVDACAYCYSHDEVLPRPPEADYTYFQEAQNRQRWQSYNGHSMKELQRLPPAEWERVKAVLE